MRQQKFILLVLLTPFFAKGQVIIGSGTSMALTNNPVIIIHSSGNLVNNSASDFSQTRLDISLHGNVTGITGNWTTKRFELNTNEGVINLNGNLTITERIIFSSGIIRPQTNSKILFIGSDDNVNTEVDGNSYVDGIFYQTGRGARQFPVGTNTTYAPVTFENSKLSSTDEFGVQAFDANANIQPDGIKVIEIVPGRYWQIFSAKSDQINSRVSVGMRGIPVIEGSTVVVQANGFNTVAANLGIYASKLDEITSKQPVTTSILAIGRQTEITVKINDLITPYKKDDFNDKLFIQFINQFEIRRVTLMDRWGVVVHTWKDYLNEDDSFDFATLAPGNYICVVEYGDAEKISTLSQMVTVLKAN